MVSFLFSLTPPDLTTTTRWIWIVSIVLFLVASIVTRVMLQRSKLPSFERAPWERVGRSTLIIGILLWCFLFFRYEGIPSLSARFWLAGIVIGGVFWAWRIVRHLMVIVPRQRREREATLAKKRYLAA